MRVIIVIRDFFSIGGAENFAREFALNLKKKNVDVKVITSRKSLIKKNKFFRNIKVIQIYSPNIRIIGTLIYCFSLFIYFIFHFREYDIIQSFFLKHSSFVSVIAGKILKKKVFCRMECSGNFGDIKTLKKIPFSFIFLKIFKISDGIIVLSNEMKKELEYYGFNKDKLFLIPNAVDVEKFIPPTNKEEIKKKLGFENKKIVIFIGRLTKQKGINFLLEAFKEVDNENKFLIILGEGELKESLFKKIENLGIKNRIWFGGKKDNVIPYLQAADVFVLTSISEGLPIVLLEAMSCGLPVIVSNVGGNIDVVENEINGYVVFPYDIKRIKIHIEDILKDEKKANLMGNRNRKKVIENYSCEAIIKKYLEIYSK
jgi:glycosyltransferase involved in cell wall biosynthesis